MEWLAATGVRYWQMISQYFLGFYHKCYSCSDNLCSQQWQKFLFSIFFFTLKPFFSKSVYYNLSQTLIFNQSIRRRYLGRYQANSSINQQNPSLQCRGNTEAASEVAFRCVYTLFNAVHECICFGGVCDESLRLISPSDCRCYLPVLRDFPAKFIYDPWNAPEDVQRAAKCVIGVDYPKPMVNHAEASRLNIERMRQIYQQLSRYRGLSLLAAVPSNHMEVIGVREAQGAAAPPTRRRTASATSSHRVRREQPGPSGVKHRGAKHRYTLSHRTSPYTPQSDLSEHDHEFAVPQQPGRLIWPVGGGTGKREREAEHSGCHGDGGPSPSSSALKAQDDEKRREDGEGVAFSS